MDYSRYENAIIKAQLTELRSRAEGEIRFNPYHDPRNGRFTNSSIGSGASAMGTAMFKGTASTRKIKEDYNGNTLISDGFRIHKHKGNIKTDVAETDSDGISAAYNNLVKAFVSAEKSGNVVELSLPSITNTSNMKVGNTKHYDFGEDMPLVNSRFLREAMLAVPNAKIYVKKDFHNSAEISPIRLVNDKGDEAYVLPVRKSVRADPIDHG